MRPRPGWQPGSRWGRGPGEGRGKPGLLVKEQRRQARNGSRLLCDSFTHITCHSSTYTSSKCYLRVKTVSVGAKSLPTIDGHGLCEIGRNKPLCLRLAPPCPTNELDRSNGRLLGRSRSWKKEWSMAQSRESTSREQSRSGASGSSASGSSGDRAQGGSEGTSGGGAGLSDQGTEMIGQAQDQAMKLVDTARQQATSQFSLQQQRFAGTLNTVATALHDASRELRKQDEVPIADYVDSAAGQVEQFANTLREQNLEQLMNTTAQFARRQPALFLGAAFALGFAATRFIKSSTPSSRGQISSGDSGLWYERPDGYGTSSYGSGYGYGGGVSDLGYGGTSGSTGQMGGFSGSGSGSGMGSSGSKGSGSSMSSGSSMGSAGTGSFDSGSSSSGAMGSSGSSGSGGLSSSSGSSESGGSSGSGSQGGSRTGGGSRSGSEGQSRSNASSGAEG